MTRIYIRKYRRNSLNPCALCQEQVFAEFALKFYSVKTTPIAKILRDGQPSTNGVTNTQIWTDAIRVFVIIFVDGFSAHFNLRLETALWFLVLSSRQKASGIRNPGGFFKKSANGIYALAAINCTRVCCKRSMAALATACIRPQFSSVSTWHRARRAGASISIRRQVFSARTEAVKT